MKPALLVVSSVLFSSPFVSLPPAPLRHVPLRHAATTAPSLATTNLTRLVWLAKADAAGNLQRTKFSMAREGKEVLVRADPALLRDGLAKLMSSSARYMKGRNARMEVRLTAYAGKVTLELSDTGPGMSVQDLVAMYGDGNSGLAEVRRRIERAGGVINISSAEGVGTVYVIDLPRAGA